MGEEDVTRGLPADLASVLRDQSVIVPQDAAVFELIAAWAKAPTPTASAEVAASRALLASLVVASQLRPRPHRDQRSPDG